MNDRDLINLIEAIQHLSEGIKELGSNLPPTPAARLKKAQEGVRAALLAIVDRHNPKPVEFSEADDGCVTFTMDYTHEVNFGEEADNRSVAQTRPSPPRPKTVKK